jgi:methionine sulfoxide reductase heme-binding subunit
VYGVAGLAILHFFWMRAGKHNFAEVFVYAAILGTLLGWRVWRYLHEKRQKAAKAVNAAPDRRSSARGVRIGR